jgi:hypothetical protein
VKWLIWTACVAVNLVFYLMTDSEWSLAAGAFCAGVLAAAFIQEVAS